MGIWQYVGCESSNTVIRFDVSETAMWCLESDWRVCLTSSLLNPRTHAWPGEVE